MLKIIATSIIPTSLNEVRLSMPQDAYSQPDAIPGNLTQGTRCGLSDVTSRSVITGLGSGALIGTALEGIFAGYYPGGVGFLTGLALGAAPIQLENSHRISAHTRNLWTASLNNAAIGLLTGNEVTNAVAGPIAFAIVGAALPLIPAVMSWSGQNPAFVRAGYGAVTTGNTSLLWVMGGLKNASKPATVSGLVASGLLGGLIGVLPEVVQKSFVINPRSAGHFQNVFDLYLTTAIMFGLALSSSLNPVAGYMLGLASPAIRAIISALEHFERLGERTTVALQDALQTGALGAIFVATMAPGGGEVAVPIGFLVFALTAFFLRMTSSSFT
jgi:hypothetical protein